MSIITAKAAAELARVSELHLLTSFEGAVYLRCSRTKFEVIVKDFAIPAVRPAGPKGDRLFMRADLDAHIRSSRQTAA